MAIAASFGVRRCCAAFEFWRFDQYEWLHLDFIRLS